MNTQEPGVYKLYIEDSRPAYEHLATTHDTIRIVTSDGTWFEITMPQPNLLMVRATNCLTVHPDSANQIGVSQTVRYATLPAFRGPPEDDESDIDDIIEELRHRE